MERALLLIQSQSGSTVCMCVCVAHMHAYASVDDYVVAILLSSRLQQPESLCLQHSSLGVV